MVRKLLGQHPSGMAAGLLAAHAWSVALRPPMQRYITLFITGAMQLHLPVRMCCAYWIVVFLLTAHDDLGAWMQLQQMQTRGKTLPPFPGDQFTVKL